MNQHWIGNWLGAHADMEVIINQIFFKLAAVPISMLGLFVVYWLLPNRKIKPLRVVPVAILVGLALESLKYISLLVWPLFNKLQREYGCFRNSVTILLWSFVAAMIVLAGAEWSVRREGRIRRCILNADEKLERDRLRQTLPIPVADLERIAPTLDALEEIFRPLARSLPAEIEPAVIFRPLEDAE